MGNKQRCNEVVIGRRRNTIWQLHVPHYSAYLGWRGDEITRLYLEAWYAPTPLISSPEIHQFTVFWVVTLR